MAPRNPKQQKPKAALKAQELFGLFDDLNDKPRITAAVEQVYAADAVFEDPIQRAEGRAAIAKMYGSMGAMFSDIGFTVRRQVADEQQLILEWDMSFTPKRWPFATEIPGVSWIEFDAQGLIRSHVDYWDLWAFVRRIVPVGKWIAPALPEPLRKLLD